MNCNVTRSMIRCSKHSMFSTSAAACKDKRLNLAKPQSGIALVVVLAFLVLITGLVVAFFSSVTNELAGSSTVSATLSARELAYSANQFVEGTIRTATSGSNRAWASQPGMIRTYAKASSKGQLPGGDPYAYYKLYSSDNMVVTEDQIIGSSYWPEPDPPSDWSSKPALFTDLNSPITKTDPTTNTPQTVYPIMDPNAQGLVDGFTINKSSPVVSGSNPAPMPVRWLYVLRDGTLTAPDNGGDGNLVKFTSAGTGKVPSVNNPIVGRIAFWTDDESCKVNINTASEGTYWDVPRVYSQEDFGQSNGTPGFGLDQPAQKEFQRYPGHPATTSLSPVFGNLMGMAVTYPYPAKPSAADANKLDPYYKIAPRVGLTPSSRGGTMQPTGSVNLDKDRLYASIDELMFAPTVTGTTRTPTSSAVNANGITDDALAKARFFITASSNAPEVTLFNTPRIAVWPIAASSGQRTVYDSLLAFCSTLGGHPYYFTRTPRSGARSSTADYTADNARLYQYLQSLTGRSIPGFGGNFLAKYPQGSGVATDRDQILTYIYDYIRCTNLQDSTAGTGASYTPPYDLNSLTPGAGEVIPIRIGQTQGFGRFLSISSANLLFYGTATTSGKTTKMRALFFVQPTTPMQGMAAKMAHTKYVVKGLDKLQVVVSGSTMNLNLPPGGTNHIQTPGLEINRGRDVGGTENPAELIRKKGHDGIAWKDADSGGDSSSTNVYPFFSSSDVNLGATPPANFTLVSPGEVTVDVYPDEGGSAIQTFHLQFPGGTFKTPTVSGTNIGQRNLTNTVESSSSGLVRATDTLVSLQVAGTQGSDPKPGNDATAGDIRMVASLINVPATRFRAHNNYTTPGVQFAHGLLLDTGDPYPSGSYGTLVANANYLNPGDNPTAIWRHPDVPSRVPANQGVMWSNGGSTGRGDWDTGFGDQKDGAYINKPDEGDTALNDPDVKSGNRLPYMLGNRSGWAAATANYFSPNRQIPSPMMFGSIPTGVQRMLPWQTLLFNPHPENTNHPGFGTPQSGPPYTLPPDHLIADLFWMPVVEPYAISTPMATSGKINMNYQIMPFGTGKTPYITRATGIYAVLRATKFLAIPTGDASTYKPFNYSSHNPTVSNLRRSIDVPKTLADFKTKFDNNDIFRSATQICEVNLVPPDVPSAANMAGFWNAQSLTGLTGDNLREKPYADLYSRLTTKSNVFTVHVRAQSLKKALAPTAASGWDQWDEKKDAVLGECRESAIIERYIDQNIGVDDFADPKNFNYTLDHFPDVKNAGQFKSFYKFRTISTKQIGE
jgi:uncharacterized protein (TIGR02600 family)